MSSTIQTLQRNTPLPVSHVDSRSDRRQEGGGLRRRFFSLSLKIQPISSPATSWAASFQRSKSLSSMGEYATSSIRKWWDWSCSWILFRKPTLARDLEMNEEETRVLGGHNNGSLRHIFYKVRSEMRKLVRSDKVGLPQTYRYDSFNYSKNFDDGNRTNC